MSLLILAFPKIRILWSRSTHATVEIFRSLKMNRSNPDPVTASSIGSLAGLFEKDGLIDDEYQDEIKAKAAAQEMLLSLPGININNYKNVMNNVENIAELSQLGIEPLTKLIGPVNAKKLYSFFNQRM